VTVERLVPPALLALLVPLELVVLRAPLALVVTRERQARLAREDTRDTEDSPAWLVCPDLPVPTESKDLLVQTDLLDPEDPLEAVARLVRMA
jgi:hypothetical protein